MFVPHTDIVGTFSGKGCSGFCLCLSGLCGWARNQKLSASVTATASPPPSALCAAPTVSPTCPPASPAAPEQKGPRPRRTSLRSLCYDCLMLGFTNNSFGGDGYLPDCTTEKLLDGLQMMQAFHLTYYTVLYIWYKVKHEKVPIFHSSVISYHMLGNQVLLRLFREQMPTVD